MGWWEQHRSGASFVANDGDPMVWGDGPADVLDDAIKQIVREFEEEWDRRPTSAEIRAGLEFALSAFDEPTSHLTVVPS